MENSITVYPPATVANIVCGFDVLGFALESPCDKMLVRRVTRKGITILNKDDFDLPPEPEKNVAGAALLAMMEELPEGIGFEVESTKSIKPGSGIGSSAASASGAVVGANYLLGNRFSDNDLVRFAMAGEAVASGVRHADNLAPCIYGGITLIRSMDPLDIVKLSAPPLYVAIIHPQIEVKTSDARQILKKQILLSDGIKQWGNIAGLVAGFMKGDYDLISRSLVDVIIEPVRSILIPGFEEIKRRSKEAGALGGGISGSGPAMFMLCRDEVACKEVAAAGAEVYSKMGLNCYTYVSRINPEGVKIAIPQVSI
jgi:homoserine kinase